MPRRLVPDYPHRIEHLARRVGTYKLYPRYPEQVCTRCLSRHWRHTATCSLRPERTDR